ncbi:conserved hypothetical protein [Ricinus communis]|uniref:RNase H type-1 domain-containing protein n=1 Tax=Ricinus communis TaxID=3988 RepID=B9SRV0_RICCO|nr:conserved hypothetical protein [Ricinus communis]
MRVQLLVREIEEIQSQALRDSNMRLAQDPPQPSSWSRPLPGKMKFNIDAVFSKDEDTAGVGIVCRNSLGTSLMAAPGL